MFEEISPELNDKLSNSIPLQSESSSATEQGALLDKAQTLKESITRSWLLLGETLFAIQKTKAWIPTGCKSYLDYVMSIGLDKIDASKCVATAVRVKRLGMDKEATKFTPSVLSKITRHKDDNAVRELSSLPEVSVRERLKTKGAVDPVSPKNANKSVFIATLKDDQNQIVAQALEKFKKLYNTTEETNVTRGLFVEMTAQEFLNMPETQALDSGIE